MGKQWCRSNDNVLSKNQKKHLTLTHLHYYNYQSKIFQVEGPFFITLRISRSGSRKTEFIAKTTLRKIIYTTKAIQNEWLLLYIDLLLYFIIFSQKAYPLKIILTTLPSLNLVELTQHGKVHQFQRNDCFHKHTC